MVWVQLGSAVGYKVVQRLSGMDRNGADRKGWPFASGVFLDALLDSHSVSGDSGWEPCHLVDERADPDWIVPLYQKSHTYGEYVFDWAWADVYQQLGMPYYPKLVSAIPVSPVTGSRLWQKNKATDWHTMAEYLDDYALRQSCSSWHVLFPTEHEHRPDGVTERMGVQFHWRNRHYQSFDDFLDTLKSKSRKNIRRERRKLQQTGIHIDWKCGDQIDAELWAAFYQLYARTYLKRSGHAGYLTQAFFPLLGERLRDQVALCLAYHQGQLIAGSLFLYSSTHLYGRYWGALMDIPGLHFECCYYQGIAWAIQQGLTVFDAGAQGEHKLIRGFEPVKTFSWHKLMDERLQRAFQEFAHRETAEMEAYYQSCQTALPFKALNQDRRSVLK